MQENLNRKNQTVYIPEYDITVDTEFTHPEDIRYSVQTQIYKENRDNYWALNKIGRRENLVKEVNGVFNQVRRGVGAGVFRLAESGFRGLGYGGYLGLNVLDNVYKSAINQSIEQASDAPISKIFKLDFSDVDIEKNKEKIANVFGEKQNQIITAMDSVKNRNEEILLKLRMGKEQGDNMIFDISSGFASFGAALGITALTGGSGGAAAAFFGLSQGMSSYDEAVENGLSPRRAAFLGGVIGTGEAALEGLGLSIFLKAIKNKGIKNMVAAVLEEPIQEMAQQANEEVFMQLFGGRKKEIRDTVYDIAYSGLIGLIVGAPMGAGGQILHQRIISEGSEQLQKQGLDKKTADTLSEKAAAAGVSPVLMKAATNIMRNAASGANNIDGNIDNNVNMVKEAISNAQKKLSKEQRQFIGRIKEEVKKDALQAGLSEEESELTSRVMESRAILWQNYTGTDAKEWYETNKLKIINDVKNGKGKEENGLEQPGKEYYERQARNVSIKNAKNEEILIENGGSEEQADLLAKLGALRHEIHSADIMFLSAGDDEGVKSLDRGEMSVLLEENGLPSLITTESPLYTTGDTDDMIADYLGKEEEDLTAEDREEFIEKVAQEWGQWKEEVNDEIEAYLGKIDEKYKTKYKPTGALRENYYQSSTNKEFEEEKEQIIAKAKENGTYLKVPNGKYSNLSPDRWATVRTKAFKEWFGDWENAYRKQELEKAPVVEIPQNKFVNTDKENARQQAIKWAKETKLNEKYETPIGTVVIDERSIKNSLSHNWNQKKADAVYSLKDGFRNAVYIGGEKDFDRYEATDHYFVYPATYKGKKQFVFCRVIQDKNLTRLYIHEVFSEDNIINKTGDTFKTAAYEAKHGGGIALYRSILQKVLNVNEKNVSKVVDDNGEPLVVYHGTKAEFNIFKESSEGGLGRGIYFTEDESFAKGVNPRVMPVFLNIRNPYMADYPINNKENAKIRKEGYDGIYHKQNKFWVAFDSKEVKSVNNRGTFDKNNPDIYYQEKSAPRARISFESEGAIIKLMESHDKSSIVHELGHLFLKDIEKISKLTDDENFKNIKKRVDEYLKVEFDKNGNALYDKPYGEDSGEISANPHEKFANAFTAYIKTGQAPNSALKRIFMMFKQWITQIKDALVDSEVSTLKASPEMLEVFDELLAPLNFEKKSFTSEERKEITQHLKDIKSGKDINVKGLTLDEIREYLDQVNRRAPKLPHKDLLYYIKKYGVRESFPLIDKAKDAGIKVVKRGTKEYEKALGEDNLQTFLSDRGFILIDSTERESVLETVGSEELQKESLNKIEKAIDGERVFSENDRIKVEEYEEYHKNIDAIKEMLGGDFEQVDNLLKLIDTFEDKKYAIVSLDTIERLQVLSERVDRQRQLIGESKTMKEINNEVIRDRQELLRKKEQVKKQEKKVKAMEREWRKQKKQDNEESKKILQAVKKEIWKEKEEIKKEKKEIFKEIEKIKNREKALSFEEKLYKDIRDVINGMIEKNEILKEKIDKKNIEEAIKNRDSEELFRAVKNALSDLENEYENSPEYQETKKIYLNPSIILREKKKALLETAKKRIEDGKDKTGYRAALRSAMSGIPHFSNNKNLFKWQKEEEKRTGKEEILDEYRNISSWQELIDNLDKIFRVVETRTGWAYQSFIKNEIEKEIKKNIWVKKGKNKIGRYDAETNEFFKELQRIWEADPKELEVELRVASGDFNDIASEASDYAYYKIENTKKIENRLKTWRLLSPTQRDTKGNILSQELYDLIKQVRREANKGFSIRQQNEKANFAQFREKLIAKIKNEKMAKGVNLAVKIFTHIEGNWDSITNLLFGRENVEKLSILKEQSEADTHIETDLKDVLEKSGKIFGGMKNFFAEYQEMSKRESVWNDYKLNQAHPGKPESVKLTDANILTFYIWAKNPDLLQRLLVQFEVPEYDDKGNRRVPLPKNIIKMFERLTPKQKALGDMLQREAQKYYESTNEVYRRLTGLELGEQEAYFPSVAKAVLTDAEMMRAKINQITSPGAVKERTKSFMVRQEAVDPLEVLQRHIKVANKYIFEQEKKIKLRKLMLDTTLRNAIEQSSLGKDVYRTAMNTIDRISLPGTIRKMTQTESVLNKIVGNIVKTYIAIKPTIAIKQMISFVNYSEKIPKQEFAKYLFEFLKNPKEAIAFMMENGFLKARFEQGQSNEAIKRLMRTDLANGASTFNKWLTLNVRLGDAAAIVFGGYAQVKYNIAQGMSKEEAFDKFELATLRSQQAGQSSSIAAWQDNGGGFGMLFSAFRNSQGQYARKIVDAYIQMRRKEITPREAAETLMIYAVYNGMMYTLVGLGFADFFDDDSDKRDLAQIIVSPLSTVLGALPFLDDMVNTLGQYLIAGKQKYNTKAGDVIGVTDLTEWYHSTLKDWFDEKKDLDLEFWIKFADFPIKAGMGVPLTTIINALGGLKQAATGEDVARGFLRILGYTDKRAGKILMREK